MLINNKELYEDLQYNPGRVMQYLEYHFPYGPDYSELIFTKHGSEDVICMRKTGVPLTYEEVTILRLYKWEEGRYEKRSA